MSFRLPHTCREINFFQLIQNFFVWFTSSLFWLYFTPFYERLLPLFSVKNNPGKRRDHETEGPGRLKSSFKIVQDVKYLLYGSYDDDVAVDDVNDDDDAEAKFFGDPWSVNITHSYFDAFSPGNKRF